LTGKKEKRQDLHDEGQRGRVDEKEGKMGLGRKDQRSRRHGLYSTGPGGKPEPRYFRPRPDDITKVTGGKEKKRGGKEGSNRRNPITKIRQNIIAEISAQATRILNK